MAESSPTGVHVADPVYPPQMPEPTVGRIVHYVLPSGRSAGEVRPAIVVRIWAGPADYVESGRLQLQVFTDGANDGPECSGGILWATSVRYDPTHAPGTWHWPPRA